MRILMLTPRFPYPPDRGDTLRSWGVLEGLAQRHEVWLATTHHSPPATEHLAHVRQRCRAVAVWVRKSGRRWLSGAGHLLAGRSLTEGYFCDRRMAETLRHWSKTTAFDALLTFSSSIAPLAEIVPAARRVLDMCDVDSAKWAAYAGRSLPPLRWLYACEAGRVKTLEIRAAQNHDVCLLVNRREQRKFAAVLPDVPTDVVPTAVNVAAYRDVGPPDGMPPPEPVIGMVGSMFYPPNVQAVNWFGRYVWPSVRRQVPGAQWLIVGARPVRSVRRWGRCANVTVTGYVADVRPYLRAMRVFISPVVGDIGVQSKVVVALAAGRPAVVTSDVAAGLEYDNVAAGLRAGRPNVAAGLRAGRPNVAAGLRAGRPAEPPFLVADGPAEFAAAVARLATDAELWRRLHRRAQAAAEAHYRVERQVALVERWLAREQVPPADRAPPDVAAGLRAGRPPAPVCT